MKKKKVLVVVGTRPEIIKMAPVIHNLVEREDTFNTKVCLTGQHREMLYQSIEFFDINVDYNLNVMRKGQTLSQLTAALVKNLTDVLEDFKPHIILVQGDTTSAFVGALVGNYHRIQVGHVEAGLRTYNKNAPFPEETNRCLITVLTDRHFAPTLRAKQALITEGVDESKVIVSGNTVVDALFQTIEKIKVSPPLLGEIEPIVSNGHTIVLITGHRRENFGKGFENICMAVQSLAEDFRNCNFIYPVHLNPKVQRPVFKILGDVPNVHLVPPMGYVPFVRLMSASHMILTDSGGIQEEAPSLGKPVLVMRDATERPEAIEAGTAILVGVDKHKIVREASRLLTDDAAWEAMSKVNNPYGDGKAAVRIVDCLESL
jgi:UDP-N-acetylglucosamine 2-epimerase (non-hydrolysing)